MNMTVDVGSEYVLEIPYTWGYFDYQAPPLLNYAAARAGFPVHDLDQPFTYCDLGCGNGVTAVMLAAAFPKAHIWGIDFNPDHIANARAFAERAGVTNTTFLDISFGQAANEDLPLMDYITMQGIYSWVSSEVQEEIHAFIDRKAADNCLTYLCYNAYPGATKLLPMWKVMQSFGQGNGKPVTENVPQGLKLLQQIEALDGRFFRENPSAAKRLDRIAARDISYLVHEFGNGAFEPQFFGDMNTRFATQGFQFVGSAELVRNRHSNIVSSKFNDLLAGIPGMAQREAVFSFVANETFRWDVFCKSKAQANPRAESRLDKMVFSLSGSAQDITGHRELGRRRLDLDDPVTHSIVSALDGACLDLERLGRSTGLERIKQEELARRLDALLACGVLIPAAKRRSKVPFDIDQRFDIADAVNRVHLQERLFVDGRAYFASPILGTAVRFNLVDSCCVLALTDKTDHAAEDVLLDLLKPHQQNKSVSRRFRKTGITRDAVSRYLGKFRQTRLPNLVTWKILKAR